MLSAAQTKCSPVLKIVSSMQHAHNHAMHAYMPLGSDFSRHAQAHQVLPKFGRRAEEQAMQSLVEQQDISNLYA